MVRRMLTGNAAAAWGARLAAVDYVPAFPITPQTEIIEALAGWSERGEIPARFVQFDSEHSMITAAGAAAATGVRVFTATSSQGLLYALETLYTTAGWRTPFVLVNVSRALSAPITLGPDHNDVLAARDAGLVQLHAETCQEVLDSVLMAYRIAEDPRVSLPVLVNLDGFQLSFTREPVDVPDEAAVARFLPPFAPQHPGFRASRPVAHGVAVLDPAAYSYFRYQMHLANERAYEVHAEAAADFAREFGRSYGAVDAYRLDDAELALVMIGSSATLGKAAVDRWREAGRRVGLLRLRLVRPWPVRDIVRHLSGLRAVAVLDQNLAPGSGGILFAETAATLARHANRLPVLRSFVGGLGGKEISPSEFDAILAALEAALAGGDESAGTTASDLDAPRGSPAELLFTAADEQRVKRALQEAGKQFEPWDERQVTHEGSS